MSRSNVRGSAARCGERAGGAAPRSSLIALALCLILWWPGGPGAVARDGEGGGDDAGVHLDEPALSELLDELDRDDAGERALDEVMRRLAAYRENPVDVNRAGVAELSRVPFMNPASAIRIVVERAARGPVLALNELVARGCLGAPSLARVSPYLVARPVEVSAGVDAPTGPGLPAGGPNVSAEDPAGPGEFTWELRARLSLDERYDDAWGAGTPSGRLASFVRLRVASTRGLSLGLACEKDAGERGWLDHTAASLSWRDGITGGHDRFRVSSACLGDFTGSWAQGLVMRSGTFASTSGYPRRGEGLRGYDGAGEAAPRRGAFVTIERARAAATALAAATRLDAATDDWGRVTSVRTSGYHRTDSEESGRGVLEEVVLGSRVRAAVATGVELGACVLGFRYSPAFAPGDPERKRFAFAGSELVVWGVDARLGGGASLLAVEAARNSDGGTAVLCAGRASRGRARVHAGIASLARDYASPVGGGVPGFPGGSNGVSAWAGIAYRTRGGWKLACEILARARPWRSYYLELPDASTSVSANVETRLGRLGRITTSARVRSCRDEEGDESLTVERRHVRTKVAIRLGGRTPASVFVARNSSHLEDEEEGSVVAVGASGGVDIGDAAAVEVGVTAVVKTGSVRPEVQYEPRLPGEFGLRSLNASGTRWYIRVQTRGPLGAGVTVRAAGGPERGGTEFGVGIDARG